MITLPSPRIPGSRLLLLALLITMGVPSALRATVDDALSFAYEAALPYYKQGFSIRKDAWGGDLAVRDKKAVSSQLFKGNDYWFLMATDVKGASLSVHLLDPELEELLLAPVRCPFWKI